jgi:hypothetical protein
MTAVAYPSSLPQQAHQNYTESIPDNRIVSAMDWGPPQTRKRGTTAYAPVSFSVTVSAAIRDAIVSFYRDDLVEGTLLFQHADFAGRGTTHTYLFQSPPTYSHQGKNLWRVEFQLWKVADL